MTKRSNKWMRAALFLLAVLVMAFRVSACNLDTFSPAAQPGTATSPGAAGTTPPAAATGTAPANADVTAVLARYDCVQGAEPETAQLVKVIDGDTVDVRMGGREYRLRYIGVNAPESSEGLGREASEANAGLVEGQTLYLIKDVSDTDQYGRLLRYVFTGSLFVNYELAAGGWARQGDYPPDTACSQTLSEAEQTAREAKLGLWAASAAGPAAAALQIVTVYYDGQAGQNEPDEYVEIRNSGAQTVNLADWYLKDLGRNRFIFPNLEMTPGQTCRVYTNEDHPESCGLSFGKSGSAVWNNSGDCAALYDPAGYLVDEFCYP